MEGPFYVMSHQSLGNSGIEWLCLENSPCYDTVPQDIFTPEFFFRVLVTNSNVDNSTYCNHQLTFLLHIHGLPLSSRRALFIVMVSSSLFGGLVVLYIIFCLLWPYMVKACTMLRWKINNIIASESSYTYASSSRAFSISSQASLRPPSKASSKVDAKVEEDKAK